MTAARDRFAEEPAPLVIDLAEMRVAMRLGLHDFERARAQNVLISVRLEVDETRLRPGEFCDYDALYEHLKTYANVAIETQEELTDRIARFALGLKGVARVIVQSRKPDIFPEAAYVGVTRTLRAASTSD